MSNTKKALRRHRAHWTAVWAVALLALPLLAHAAWTKGGKLPAITGNGVTGSAPDTTGKVVLVDFWASWCGPCRKSFPEMQKLHEKFAARGLVIVAVSVDQTQSRMDKFLESNAVTFTTVRDGKQALVKAAGIQAMPTSFLVDRKGVIREVHTGFKGKKTVEAYEQEIEKLLQESP